MIGTRGKIAFGAVTATVAGLLTASLLGGAAPAAAAVPASQFHAVQPTHVFDTKTGLNITHGGVGGGRSVPFRVVSAAGLPSNTTAVALTVTATGGTVAGYVTAYPDDQGVPRTSNFSFGVNVTISNMVVVRVPSDGTIRLYNGGHSGGVYLSADILGYYTGTNSPGGQGSVGMLANSFRKFNTSIGSNSIRNIAMTGQGVPADASAVIVNLSASGGASTSGGLRVFAAGASVPATTDLNYRKGNNPSNLVFAPLSLDGQISIQNVSPGSVAVVGDVYGYVTAGDPLTAGAMSIESPQRVIDSTNGEGTAASPIQHGQSRDFVMLDQGGLPQTGVSSVVVNVTVSNATANGTLRVYAGTEPSTTNLYITKGITRPILVQAGLDGFGRISVHNTSATGSIDVQVDVQAYTLTNAISPVPSISVSHYIRGLTGATAADDPTAQANADTANVNFMTNIGCNDGLQHSKYTLLDIGVQAIVGTQQIGMPPVTTNVLGVVLSATNTRLDYAHLTTALNAFLNAFSFCWDNPTSTSGTATIAIGTNNSGNDNTYPAANKGIDWAALVNGLTAGAHESLVGANDIEASFGNSPADAAQWELSYLGATAKNLVYNGSLDNCPTIYGSSSECGAVQGASGLWTRSEYVSLTHGLAPGRIQALPQIYFGVQAAQWANIDHSANGAIQFAGVLTENASNCGVNCAMTPTEGFAALYHGISTLVNNPNIPAITDLRIN